ncbi:MAG: hypothetical protein RMN51_00985 [Verrucomicrobiota bacterium]|nr:hypothetical protein [Limisphaera sp.]MDW8380673.1 hypothetical protein [Verrucomicrobiota bacterium]
MTDPRQVVRSALVYTICLPLAAVLGYYLADPMDFTSFLVLGTVFLILLIPILLNWHQPLLILSWHTLAVVPFLPGRPPMRLALTCVSIIIILLVYALDRRQKPILVPSVTWALVYLSAVIVVTYVLTGGAGFGFIGSEVGGGSRYVALAGAILGFFALSAKPIPPEKALLYTGYFFLGGLTLALSSAVALVPDWLRWVYYIFPVERSTLFAPSPTGLQVGRMYGVATASLCGLCYMTARYGLRGIFDIRRPWRLVIALTLTVGVAFGGYRSFVLLAALILAIQFYLEGFLKWRYLPLWITIAGLFISLLPISHKLPYQVQRSLAWIPWLGLEQVREDARLSTQWRLELWQRVLVDVPRYFWLGKGYAINVRDLEFAQFRRFDPVRGQGELTPGELAELAGDYHNGPLSVIVPLGVWGAIGVLWFWYASWRILLRNYRYGPPELRTLNTFLLALFCARVIHFMVVFGAFYAEFYYFTGLVAFSIAVNRGLAVAQEAPRAQTAIPAEPAAALSPAPVRPVPVRM